MHTTNLLVVAVLAASVASAAPATTEKSMMASVPQWTIVNLKRSCDQADHTCTWNFGIDTHLAPATGCTLVVKSNNKASQSNGGPATCGPYTVTSGWSGQFGPGNGFTTLAVTNFSKKLITWPAYTDKQVQGGKVVTPNQSYAPANLP